MQTKGRPRNHQPQSSTARDPSSFERSATVSSAKQKELPDVGPPGPAKLPGPLRNARKRARRGRRNCGSDQNGDEEEYHDPSEDDLMHQELARLLESNGSADPLWAEEDLAGMSNATKTYALRKRNRKE